MKSKFNRIEQRVLLRTYVQKGRKPIEINFNSHAVGMAVAQPFDFEIDFASNYISGSAA